MPPRNNSRAALEALALVGQLGLVCFVSFAIPFGLGWLADDWLGTKIFVWLGLLGGIVSLYWNGSRVLKKFWQAPTDATK